MPQKFQILGPDDIFVDTSRQTTGLFSNGSGNLAGSSMYSQSLSGSSDKRYYYNIQDTATDSTATVRFSVAYGHFYGSGSDISTGSTSLRETEAIYKQWTNALLDDPMGKFQFHHPTQSTAYHESDFIWVITADNAVMKNSLDRKWTLTLSASNEDIAGKGAFGVSGSSLVLTNFTGSRHVSRGGVYYVVISGSAGVPHDAITPYGRFYPDYGAIVLSGTKLSASLSGPIHNTESGSTGTDTHIGFAPDNRTVGKAWRAAGSKQTEGADNANKMVMALQAGSVTMRTVQELNQTLYYCRAKHNQFNWSTNPSFVQSGSVTHAILDDMRGDPNVYVTTIGLVNSREELVAVAKINRPQKKNHSKELVVAVSIDG